MAGFSHNLESTRNRKAPSAAEDSNSERLARYSAASRGRSKRQRTRGIHPNLTDGMARSTRQFIPQPLGCLGFFRRRVVFEACKQRNPVRTRLLNALQPMEQDGLSLDRRVHNLVTRVETAAGAKHRVIADVLAAVANRRNRADFDLASIWMPERRTNPVVGQQDRLPAPRTVETAMRHGTCWGFNSAFCLSGPGRQGFLLGRSPTCQDLRSSHHQDISTFIAQQFHCVHLSLTSFVDAWSWGDSQAP